MRSSVTPAIRQWNVYVIGASSTVVEVVSSVLSPDIQCVMNGLTGGILRVRSSVLVDFVDWGP